MSRRRSRDTEETPWASFSDALSGMLFVFVITTFWFALRLAVEQQRLTAQKADAAAEVDRLKRADAVAADLVEKDGKPGLLTACLTDGGVLKAEGERAAKRVSLYPKRTASVLRGAGGVEVGWFGECSASLAGDLDPAVQKVRECIASVLVPRDTDYRVKVMLEGHTDALPVAGDCRKQFPSNWELSGARAAAVTRAVLGSEVGAGGRENPVRSEMDAGNLQVLAVGMGDSVAAWKAICRAPGLEPLDSEVCRVMKESANDPVRASAELERAGVSSCPSDLPGAHSLQPLLRTWANWCGESGWASAKRERLRRVDLRIEFEPWEAVRPDPPVTK
jgi:hypothetical protein